MARTNESLSQVLTQRGYKLTQPRRAVLKVIADSAETLTAAEIHRRAQRHYAHTGLVTVYRTLDVLAECGAIRKVHQPDGCHSYALASQGHGHHVICQNCQSVVEFRDCDLSALLASVQRRTGFEIRSHWLELFGVCPSCQA